MESVGDLIDKLQVCNLKIWHLIEIIENESDNDKVAEAARKCATLNRQRSVLINEINGALNSGETIIKV